MKFLKTNKKYVIAMIGKSGSSSLAKALIDQIFPERRRNYVGASIELKAGWQSWAESTENPEMKVLVPVRDPVSRFISACGQVKRHTKEQVDEILDSLEGGGAFTKNYHFTKTVEYTKNHGQECLLFKFPEQAKDLAVLAGLKPELPVINNGEKRIKPTLTRSQTERVLKYYGEDLSLFEGIVSPGKSYGPIINVEEEKEEEPAPEIKVTAFQFFKALDEKHGLTYPDIEEAINKIESDIERKRNLTFLYTAVEYKSNSLEFQALSDILGLTSSQRLEIFLCALNK